MERRCPTCRRELSEPGPAAPFCSERCRLVDLGGWLDERYRVAGSHEEDQQSLSGGVDEEPGSG